MCEIHYILFDGWRRKLRRRGERAGDGVITSLYFFSRGARDTAAKKGARVSILSPQSFYFMRVSSPPRRTPTTNNCINRLKVYLGAHSALFTTTAGGRGRRDGWKKFARKSIIPRSPALPLIRKLCTRIYIRTSSTRVRGQTKKRI